LGFFWGGLLGIIFPPIIFPPLIKLIHKKKHPKKVLPPETSPSPIPQATNYPPPSSEEEQGGDLKGVPVEERDLEGVWGDPYNNVSLLDNHTSDVQFFAPKLLPFTPLPTPQSTSTLMTASHVIFKWGVKQWRLGAYSMQPPRITPPPLLSLPLSSLLTYPNQQNRVPAETLLSPYPHLST